MFKFKKELLNTDYYKEVCTQYSVAGFIHKLENTGIEVTPHQGQLKIINAFDSRDYQMLTVGAGRRFGKSITACLLAAAELEIPGAAVVLVNYTLDNAEVNLELIRKLVWSSQGSGAIIIDKRKDMELKLRNGATLRVASNDNVEAKIAEPFSLLIIDEAKLFNRNLLEQKLRPLMFDYAPYGRVVLLTTPEPTGLDKKENWVNFYYKLGQDVNYPKYWSTELPTSSNPLNSNLFLTEMLDTMPAYLYVTEIAGKFPKAEKKKEVLSFKITVTAE